MEIEDRSARFVIADAVDGEGDLESFTDDGEGLNVFYINKRKAQQIIKHLTDVFKLDKEKTDEEFEYVFYVVEHLRDGNLIEDKDISETEDINEAFFKCAALTESMDGDEGWYSVEARKTKAMNYELCSGCDVELTIENIGGYRCYCQKCVDKMGSPPTLGEWVVEGKYPDFVWVK